MNNKDWRFEKKIVIRKEFLYSFISIIKKNNFFLNEKYPKRNIKSLYLDNHLYHSYFENINGFSERKKFRIRWYNQNLCEVINSNFDCKIKRNKKNTKIILPLKPFIISYKDNNFSIHEKIMKASSDKRYTNLLKVLKPSLLIEYNRTYFSSPCEEYRITIDKNILFRKTSNLLVTSKISNYVILEIKYPSYAEKDFKYFIKDIPYRFSRMSKYINALNSLSFL